MADDLLDYTTDSALLGKKVGADLREGKLTLPIIHCLQQIPSKKRQWLINVIQAIDFTKDQFEQLIQILHDYGSINYTQQCAGTHVTQAKAALRILSSCAERDILEDIADYALVRKV